MIFLREQCKQNTFISFVTIRRYITVVLFLTLICNLNFICFYRDFKMQKEKLALTSFCFLRQETWLDDSRKSICIDQLWFYNFLPLGLCVSQPLALCLAPSPGPRPRPPICIYRPWPSICIYRPWPPPRVCIYQSRSRFYYYHNYYWYYLLLVLLISLPLAPLTPPLLLLLLLLIIITITRNAFTGAKFTLNGP